ncbi:MAG: aldehyde ferredoxin oxidoreductase family protein [Thermodesulfobacteriota bacterium]
MFGSTGRLLTVDLSSGRTETLDLDQDDLRKYVGGSALGAKLFWDAGGASVEALSPRSPLFILTGPLTGTTFPGSSRFIICGRSPLTGIWGESASGGAFGAELKKAGYDGLRIVGRAPRPMYLLIEDDRAALREAQDLWGLDTYATVDALLARHGTKPAVRVLAIGPAGENLVKFAAVANDKAHYFGRTGLGAVLGSKNLKALAVKGSHRPALADGAAYKKVFQETMAAIKESMITASFRELGTASAMDLGMFTGDVPIKNWALGLDYDLGEALGGPSLQEKLVIDRKACFACPLGCKPVVESRRPGYELPPGPGPEYETNAAFGTMILNSDLFAVAKINDSCNRLGLDTITCGSTIAYVMEAVERGLLTRADLGGLELTWGNVAAVLEMINLIAGRQGFGDRAAEGSAALARSLGPEAAEFLVTIKGLELPMHDPRAFHGQGLAYMMSNRGACHLQHSDQAAEQGMVSWPELGLKDDYPAHTSDGKAELVLISENIGQMANAVCVCHFVHWAMGNLNLLNAFNAVTGYGFSLDELLRTGGRAWTFKRALNNFMGVTGADDRLPPRILTPLAEGGTDGTVPDEALLKSEYYALRGLDGRGLPRPERLEALGLDFLARQLYQ